MNHTLLQEDDSSDISKLKHLNHLEELIINDGVDGLNQIIRVIQLIAGGLQGDSNQKLTITTKWDGCVDGDTIVLTSFGPMKIKNIPKGASVMGRDLDNNIDKLTVVTNTVNQFGQKPWVEIELENGQTLRMTEDHEVYTQRGWIQAKELTDTDNIKEL